MMSARHNPTTELLIKPRTTSAIMIAGKAINISASAIMIESNHLPTIAEIRPMISPSTIVPIIMNAVRPSVIKLPTNSRVRKSLPKSSVPSK